MTWPSWQLQASCFVRGQTSWLPPASLRSSTKTTSWRRDRPDGKKHHDSEPRLNFQYRKLQNVLLLCLGTSMMLAIPACGLVMILHIALRLWFQITSCFGEVQYYQSHVAHGFPSGNRWPVVTSIRRTCALKYSYWMPKPPMRLHSNLKKGTPKKPVGGASWTPRSET